MKSNICELNKNPGCIENVLSEIEKVTAYNGLETKKALRIRLLTEELCGMLPGLVEKFDGSFWSENDGDAYELHVKLKADNMTFDVRDELIAVSKSGKNEAAKGIMGKIRAVAETFMLAADDPEFSIPVADYCDYYGYNMSFGYMNPSVPSSSEYSHSWSLYNYKNGVEENHIAGANDELERSIVAKLADDIIVGVKGKNVEIIVKKSF